MKDEKKKEGQKRNNERIPSPFKKEEFCKNRCRNHEVTPNVQTKSSDIQIDRSIMFEVFLIVK